MRSAPSPTIPQGAPRLILLVDDDASMLVLLRAIVEANGYAVCSASSGALALETIATGERLPDLALLDVDMPGMSGLELAGQLGQTSQIPFMFISAHAETAIVAQAMQAGAVGYLLKPFSAAQIGPSIAAALARADQILGLRQSELRLQAALTVAHDTDIAVGVLVERFHTSRETALRIMRDHARANQRKLADVAAELVAAAEFLNSLGARIKKDMKHN
jgi:response regulator NasT